jgi:hypothetical protein
MLSIWSMFRVELSTYAVLLFKGLFTVTVGIRGS